MQNVTAPNQTRLGQTVSRAAPSPSTQGSFWFVDGNVDIVTQHATFRVHRGVLAHHSKVFEKLLLGRTLPVLGGTPGHSASLVYVPNNAAVFYVTDSAQDFAELLHALYDGLTREIPVTSFPTAMSLLRLGHKYEIPALVDEVMPILRQAFPTDLDVWDRGHRRRKLKGFKITCAVEALAAFRVTQQHSMCPSALYLCAQLDEESIRNGVRRAGDGTTTRLSEADAALCLDAKERLKNCSTAMLALCHALAPGEGCACPEKCLDAMSVLRAPPEKVVQSMLIGNVLHPWVRDQAEELKDRLLVCVDCSGKVLSRIGELRTRIWNELPKMAGTEGKIEDWGNTSA